MHRRGLSLGFVLGVTAGALLGNAWSERDSLLWPVGLLVLVLAVLTALWAFFGHHGARLLAEPDTDAQRSPKLGQMLMNYGLISEADLAKALEELRGTRTRLGQVLVDAGLVTHTQIAQVLEEQLSRRDDAVTRSPAVLAGAVTDD